MTNDNGIFLWEGEAWRSCAIRYPGSPGLALFTVFLRDVQTPNFYIHIQTGHIQRDVRASLFSRGTKLSIDTREAGTANAAVAAVCFSREPSYIWPGDVFQFG